MVQAVAGVAGARRDNGEAQDPFGAPLARPPTRIAWEMRKGTNGSGSVLTWVILAAAMRHHTRCREGSLVLPMTHQTEG